MNHKGSKGNYNNLLGEAIEYMVSAIDRRPGREVPGTIKMIFRERGIKNSRGDHPWLAKWVKKDGEHHLFFRLPVGVEFNRILALKDCISDNLNAKVGVERRNDKVYIRVRPGSIPEHVLYRFNPADYPGMDIPIPVGYTAAGLLVVDLAKIPHIKVNGTTFSGKSNYLHTICMPILQNPNCILIVVDLALLEFSYMKKHAIFEYTLPGTLKLLRFLREEMWRRIHLLDSYGVNKIQLLEAKMKFAVVVIDEFSFLCPDYTRNKEQKAMRADAQTLVTELAALARKVGIHLVIATQRPDKDIIPGDLKANLPGTLCFRTINKVNSEIALDDDAAAKLPSIKGRAIWQIGVDQEEVQVMELTLNKAKEILKGLEGVDSVESRVDNITFYQREYQGKRLLPRPGATRNGD